MSLISGVRELHECSLSTVGMLVAPSVVDKYSASKPIVSNRDTRDLALYGGPLTSDLSQGHHTKKLQENGKEFRFRAASMTVMMRGVSCRLAMTTPLQE